MIDRRVVSHEGPWRVAVKYLANTNITYNGTIHPIYKTTAIQDTAYNLPSTAEFPAELIFSHDMDWYPGTTGDAAAYNYTFDWSKTMGEILSWLTMNDTYYSGAPQNFSTVSASSSPAGLTDYDLTCPEPLCSSNEICKSFWKCFFTEIRGLNDSGYYTYVTNPADVTQPDSFEYDPCSNTPGVAAQFRCGINIHSTNAPGLSPMQCSSEFFDLTAENWNLLKVDQNIQTFINGGIDSESIFWPGPDPGQPLSSAMGKQFTRSGDYQCSLEHPCNHDFTCDDIGSWISQSTSARGNFILRSAWGFYALSAFQHLNQQLSNQYNAIKGALGVLALDSFLIGDFFPTADGKLDIVNALTGLGTIFSVLSGFVPIIGPGLAATGAILPTIGTFLGNSATSMMDPLEFVPRVRQIYTNYVGALDDAGLKLFNGQSIQASNGEFNITDMLAGGAWANSSALTSLEGLETNLTVEILSRSIDALWKTPPSNKMWVHFVDLDDDRQTMSKCLADSSGPGATKYCDDGGVYYTYNYIEDGHKTGYVSYPWGGDQLQANLNINLTWVAEASAKTYRLAKRNNLDPFNFPSSASTHAFLAEAVHNDDTAQLALLNQAGRYPGSWTLPVCDSSTWGARWNWDYTNPDYDKGFDRTRFMPGDSPLSKKHKTHPPCLCGPSGGESDAWAKAAGMQDFDTFLTACQKALTSTDFQWPEGVDQVTFTGSSSHTIKKPGT
ncbi:hypothetical protein ACLMJK_005741 [Lecanora helva]